MGLHTSQVSRCLDKKLKVLGYEVPDLLAIFFLLSVLNFVFGWTGQRLLLVWFPTLALSLVLRLGKRGQPDNHLLHWFKFKTTPPYRSAFLEPTRYESPPRMPATFSLIRSSS